MARYKVTTPDGVDMFENNNSPQTDEGALWFLENYSATVVYAKGYWLKVERVKES